MGKTLDELPNFESKQFMKLAQQRGTDILGTSFDPSSIFIVGMSEVIYEFLKYHYPEYYTDRWIEYKMSESND